MTAMGSAWGAIKCRVGLHVNKSRSCILLSELSLATEAKLGKL